MAAWKILRSRLPHLVDALRTCGALGTSTVLGAQLQQHDALIHRLTSSSGASPSAWATGQGGHAAPMHGVCMQQRSFRTCTLSSAQANNSAPDAPQQPSLPGGKANTPEQGDPSPAAAGALQQGPLLGGPQLDPTMQELLGVLSQPLPLGKHRNFALNDAVVELNGSFFMDPARMMDTTMRALYVIKQVLRTNGHVCVVNSNPAFTPLMRHAARHCLNSNVWWHWEPYTAGTLLKAPASLMAAAAQPARKTLQARGLTMTNVHCPSAGVLDKPPPRLDTLDKWRLWNTRATTPTGLKGRRLLRRLVEDESRAARLLLPGAGNQTAAPTLIVVLDLSHGEQVVMDAHEAGILTASVVNAHSELDRITYPILAAEAHPAYTHFLLNWMLKVVNMPTPPLVVKREREGQDRTTGAAVKAGRQ